MIYRLSDNIISPLGETTAENYQAIKAGRSALRRYEGRWGIPEAFTASLFSEEQTRSLAVGGMTRFESLAYRSACQAIQESGIDVSGSRVVFILSTTKANVELLTADSHEGNVLSPGDAAVRIAQRLGFTTDPLVVCNACISGVSAIVLAMRLLDACLYDYAVVCGADVQSKFTVSGFQSLKAVSADECRPFDMERLGLNLGEAAATLVVARSTLNVEHSTLNVQWCIRQGAVRNDAFHISSPSKDGEGARLALEAVAGQADVASLAFINAHGTATMFNDQMESVAIERAGLGSVPVNALKGYFGHTMGAAGILETVVSMASLDDGTILGTRGFSDYGVSGKIHLSSQHEATSKDAFVKMISGFGGCNGAVYVEKMPPPTPPVGEREVLSLKASFGQALALQATRGRAGVNVTKTHTVRLTPSSLTIDGVDVKLNAQCIMHHAQYAPLLTSLYKEYVADYPKFYKMDGLSRLGFIASELLLRQEGGERFQPRTDRAVILFNHSSSIAADRKFFESIADEGDYFPSPSVFVYTLPNIVTGEIAMRNGYRGETSFYITIQRRDPLAWQIILASFGDAATRSVIGGWIDYQDDLHFEADLYIAERKSESFR